MGDRANNMGKMLNNPKQRNMYFTVIGLAVITLGGGLYYASHNNNVSSVAPAGAAVTSVPTSATAVPGASNSQEYNKKVQDANAQEAKNALNTNNTFIPTITNKSTESVSPIDMVDKQKEDAKRLKDEQDAKDVAELKRIQDAERMKLAQVQPSLVTPVSTPVQVQVANLPVAAPKAVVKPKYSQEDYILISSMMANTKAKIPASEYNFSGKAESVNTGSTGTNTNVSNSTEQTTRTTQVAPLVKAGTILNAILETAVNSDEPSPVLAKIISGPLKGTRLIGSVQTVGEKVVLQFSTANLPNLSSSAKISAVAVDPNSSRTALASDVDHHYFQRYGVLLASSFLSGWAQAITQNNQTTTITPLGGVVTVPNGNLSSKDINRQALGSVGTDLAQDAKQRNQNLKPTITVNSGIAIGILVMDDFTVNK